MLKTVGNDFSTRASHQLGKHANGNGFADEMNAAVTERAIDSERVKTERLIIVGAIDRTVASGRKTVQRESMQRDGIRRAGPASTHNASVLKVGPLSSRRRSP